MINLRTFTIDVQLQENGKFDVWISHDGNSGSHYQDVNANWIGSLVADDIDAFAEEYKNEEIEKE